MIQNNGTCKFVCAYMRTAHTLCTHDAHDIPFNLFIFDHATTHVNITQIAGNMQAANTYMLLTTIVYVFM